MNKKGIIYKTTNLINGKIYVGKYEGNKEDYMGSGLILQNAIKKYGKENFKREILEICFSKEQLCEREKFWIKELDTCNREIGYNITIGGIGGDVITNHPNRKIILNKISERTKGEKNPYFGKHHTEEIKLKMKENHANVKGKNNPNYGSDKQTGNKNGRYRVDINSDEIIKLHNQGFSYVQISKIMNICLPTIMYRVKKGIK